MVAHHPTCKCPDCELDEPSRYGGGAVSCAACGRLFVHADDCPERPGGLGAFFALEESRHEV